MTDSAGSGNKPITKVIIDRETQKRLNQKRKLELNWKLPWYGAIGFGLGFGATSGIMRTIFNLVQISVNAIFNENPDVNPTGAIFRGLIIGVAGGTALGMAFKDKFRIVNFSICGAIGFITAFILLISFGRDISYDIGGAALDMMHLPYDPGVAAGIGEGFIVGGIGGLALGLASTKGKLITSALLSISGAVWFALAFIYGELTFSIVNYSGWNLFGGAIGGFFFGFMLALYYAIHDQFFP